MCIEHSRVATSSDLLSIAKSILQRLLRGADAADVKNYSPAVTEELAAGLAGAITTADRCCKAMRVLGVSCGTCLLLLSGSDS